MRADSFAWPALALVFNSLVWGTSWWPLRYLESQGLHPLWSTALIYAVAVVAIAVVRPQSARQVARTRSLWVLVLASGTTNAAFNWGVVIGDVVRVVLLFYLMPLWAALLAWLLLAEPLTGRTLARVALALAGAGVVLWPGGSGWSAMPLPRSPADALGLLGGFAFALNNVMLRRLAHTPEEGRALAMFVGGAAVSAVLAAVLGLGGQVPWPPPPAVHWAATAALLAALFLAGNLALQFGAARLPSGITSVVMLTEVVFASASALAFGAEVLSGRMLVGGLLILLAASLSAFGPAPNAGVAKGVGAAASGPPSPKPGD